MIRTWIPAGALLAASLAFLGCGPAGKVQQQAIEVSKTQTGLEKAKVMLERYARGEPVSSEAVTFPKLIDEVRQADPSKADTLKKGLDDLQKMHAKNERIAKAKDLLKKIAPGS